MARGLQSVGNRLVVAGTGHRPQGLHPHDPADRRFGFGEEAHSALLDVARESLAQLKSEYPDRELAVITGMAQGWDQALAEAALETEAHVIAAVPHDGQEKVWGVDAQAAYHALLDRIVSAGGEVHVITPGAYNASKMQARNQWMVDRADVVLALFSGQKGGTKNCIQYAERNGVQVVNVWGNYVGKLSFTAERDPAKNPAQAPHTQQAQPRTAEPARAAGQLINVVHVRDHVGTRDDSVIYVGQRLPAYGLAAGPLSSPYSVGRDGTHEEVTAKFLGHLRAEFANAESPVRAELLRARDILLSGRDVSLAVWPSAQEAHAVVTVRHVVARLADREHERRQLLAGRQEVTREGPHVLPGNEPQRPAAHAHAKTDGGGPRPTSARAHQAHLDVVILNPVTDDYRRLYEPGDGRNRAEHASHLNSFSQSARDSYERGAGVYDGKLVEPREFDPQRAAHAAVTSRQYAVSFVSRFIPDDAAARQKAEEFVTLAEQVCGQWSDEKARIAVFKQMYDSVTYDEQGARRDNTGRAAALEETLAEARLLAAEMVRLEPQDTLAHDDDRGLEDLDVHEHAATADHLRDESELYAQIYETAVADAHDRYEAHGQHEAALLDNDARGSGGPMPETSYERVSLGDMPPALPDGITAAAEGRLLDHTLPEVDRRIESGEDRARILREVVYKEHSTLDREDKAARTIRIFSAASPEAARSTQPSRDEQLRALYTLHVLAAGEATREARRYATEALRSLSGLYARTEPEAPARHTDRPHGAAVPCPPARDLYTLNEKDIRVAQSRLLRLDLIPTRVQAERVDALERVVENTASAIRRMNPTPSEHVAALEAVSSRIGGAASHERERLNAFSEAFATRDRAENVLGRPNQHPSAEAQLRDELSDARSQIAATHQDFLRELGHTPDTPREARAAVEPRVAALDRSHAYVTMLADVARSQCPEHERPAELTVGETRAPVFVSLNGNTTDRLPVESAREHTVITRMAEANNLRLNTWHGLHGREVTGRSEEREQIARFVGDYIDFRMKDAETRLLNQSEQYREYARRLDGARSPEELRAISSEIRRENYSLVEQSRVQAQGGRTQNERRALSSFEMRQLFLSPAPAHYTPEMRDLRTALSVMGRDKEQLVAGLMRGEVKPSKELAALMREMETRHTTRALEHFARSLTTPAREMEKPSSFDLHATHQKLLPYERDYVYRVLSAKRDELAREQSQEHTHVAVPVRDQSQVQTQTADRAELREAAASRVFRSYYAAVAWREAGLFVEERDRRDGAHPRAADRCSIVEGLADRHVEAAGYVLHNHDARKARDVAALLRTSTDPQLRQTGEIIEAFSNIDRQVQTDGRVELRFTPPEKSSVPGQAWGPLLNHVHPDRSADNNFLRSRLPDAQLADIRRDAQVLAWKDMEPSVRGTSYDMDSRAGVLRHSLEVREALGQTRDLQERARVAHHAVEAHVNACVDKVQKEIASPTLIHRADPKALGAAGRAARAGAFVTSLVGLSPVSKTLAWAGANLEKSAEASGHLREVQEAGRLGPDRAVTRDLVRAALDPRFAAANPELVSKHDKEFALVQLTVTPKDQSRFRGLNSYAQRTRDDYLRSFGELDRSRRDLAKAQSEDRARRESLARTQDGRQEQRADSPSREQFDRAYDRREAELLGQRLEELIKDGSITARDEGRAADALVRDLIPASQRAELQAAAREDAWWSLMPDELRGGVHGDEPSDRVIEAAAELADAISRARAADLELSAARGSSASGAAETAHQAAGARTPEECEQRLDNAFAEIDRGQASLEHARQEQFVVERAAVFDSVRPHMEERVESYLRDAFARDGHDAFHNEELAAEHAEGIAETMREAIVSGGASLQQFNLSEKDVQEIARDLVSSLSTTLDRAPHLDRTEVAGLPHHAEDFTRAMDALNRVGPERQGDYNQELWQRHDRDDREHHDRALGDRAAAQREPGIEHTDGGRSPEHEHLGIEHGIMQDAVEHEFTFILS